MAHVNLLPWRETARQRAKTKFGIQAISAIGVAAVIFGLAYMVIDDFKSYQNQRNLYLESQIRVLDAQIAEIRNINKKKEEILNRIDLIQDLHEDRNTAIVLFNELTERTPDGVFLQSIDKRDVQLTINGRSISNNRVAEFLRSLKNSQVFAQPEIRNVVSAENSRSRNDSETSANYDAFSMVVPLEEESTTGARK